MTPLTSLRNPSRILVMIIAMLVPILVAGAFTATLAQPSDHFDDVVAAVVNNDEPVELEGEIVPLGRQLAAALVEGQGVEEEDGQVQNYDWVMTNEELAGEGLASGEYGAVVTIPPEFSAAAISGAEMDSSARQALVEVTVSPRAKLADEAITQNIVKAAAASLGHDLTESFLDNIFIGFNTLGEELGEAADGARSLADGIGELSSGAHELADGSGQLADGADELADGTAELSGGAHALAGGTRELSSGANELAGGASELAGGLGALASGTGDLASGTGELRTGVQDLRSGTKELSAGADELAGGASELATGSQEFAEGLDDFSGGLGELSGGADELAGGLTQLNDELGEVSEYLDPIVAGIIAGAVDVREFAGRLGGATGVIEQIIDEVCAADPEGEACATLREYVGESEDLDAFLAQAAAGLNELADYMEGIGADEGALGQIQQLLDGIKGLAGGANGLAGGLQELSEASGGLAAGAHGLADGNSELAAGLREFAGGASELDGGVGDLQSGVRELDQGAGALASASGQAAGGAQELAGGAGALASGTGDLASGADELAAGVGQLALGTGELATGAQELAGGTEELASGTDELSDGSDELADGLGQATEEIPTFTDDERQTLAEVIAEPTGLEDTGGLSFRWLAFFSVVALWAGGLWLLAAYPAVAANARTSTRSAGALMWRSIKTPAVIAAIQGIGVAVIVGIFANISLGTAVGFGVLAVLISVVFMAVQRGLVAYLGWAGVALTVLVAMFAVATALISTMPTYATAVLSWLPVGPAIFATQAIEFSLSSLAGPILGLLAWGAAGAIAVLLATRRAQTRLR